MPEPWDTPLPSRNATDAVAVAKEVTSAIQEQEQATERVRKRSREYHDEIRNVQREIARMSRGLSDGTLPRLVALTRQAEAMKKQMREAMAPPPRIRRAFQDDWSRQRMANERLMRGLHDGSYRALVRQRMEYDRLNQQAARVARTEQLRATYGRAGAFYARNEHLLKPAAAAGMYAGGAALAAGTGMVHRGFSGTVEANRFETELTLTSRELASAFKPQLEFATKAMRSFRRFLEDLGPVGQKVVSVLGTIAAVGASMAVFGRMTGLPVGAMAMRGLGLGGAAAAAPVAAEAAAGSASALAAGTGVAGTAAATRGGRSFLSRAGGWALRGAKSVGKYALRALPGVGVAMAGYDAVTSGDYGRFRGGGNSKIVAGAKSGINALWSGATLGFGGKIFGSSSDGGGGGGKSRLQVAGGGFEELGSGYDRLATAAGMVDASMENKDMGKTLKEIRDLLKSQAAQTMVRPPAPQAQKAD